MAHQVAWLRAAVKDLEEIADYIAADSPAYATIVVSKLHAAAMELAEFPPIGRHVPEWGGRSISRTSCLSLSLIYRLVSEERVEILSFFHGARLLPDSLKDRK